MQRHRQVALRLFTVPTVILLASITISFVIKPISDHLKAGGAEQFGAALLSNGVLAMLAGYALGCVWLTINMWRFLSWSRRDPPGDCPDCGGDLKPRHNGQRRCPMCGHRETA
ncbi:hypothetical protein CEK62_09475 [Alcanivorax sp. N3-2A]|nr:hypothetical protein CEK62_09475 [Alcanivorax sp. N3-2A]|tara:strand:- start:8808 stop:9146 length:339 start_codon:yes stop_codon:yes gene_type:complete